jgi:hypothetical protein
MGEKPPLFPYAENDSRPCCFDCELMQCYLGGLLDPSVTLLEVHKFLYFMQYAGEPLRLEYKKVTYGPYAQNLRHVLNAIEGHFITYYADGGDAPNKVLQLYRV